MDLFDEIAKLAYEIFEREGRVHGRHLDHWYEAERIVISRYESQKQEEVAKQKTAPKRVKKDAEAKPKKPLKAKTTKTVTKKKKSV